MMKQRLLSLVLIAMISTLGCEGASVADAVHEPEPPPQPDRFQELTLSALPRATELLSSILEDPGDPAPRRELARLYRDQGFHATGEFFATTADALELEEARFSTSYPDSAWVTPLRENTTAAEDEQIAAEASELATSGEPGEAVRLLEKVIAERGLSVDLLAAWSSNALLAAALEPASVSDEQFEAALRNFVTLVEETPTSPTDGFGKAADYQWLTDVLLELGDPVSAYVAASLAMDTLRPRPDSPEDLAEAERSRLSRRLELATEALTTRLQRPPAPVLRE